MTYFLTFRALGEVAEMLLLNGEEPRLLVDLSTEPVFDDKGMRRHTPRASFTITDPDLIRRFTAEMALGDVIEAEGSFVQGDYIPHRTSHIDTTFTMLEFRRVARARQKPRALTGAAAMAAGVETTALPRQPAQALLH